MRERVLVDDTIGVLGDAVAHAGTELLETAL
jgi:hypothetical protein